MPCQDCVTISIDPCVNKCSETLSSDCVIVPINTCENEEKITLTDQLKNLCENGAGCNVIEVTHAELLELISNSELDVCALYILTDYQTVYDQPDYEDTGSITLKAVLETKTSPVIEPLVIKAISSSEIDVNVKSLLYPTDEIIYSPLEATTPEMGSARKGTIRKRTLIETNSSFYYDVRHVKFKRYESAPGSGIFSSYWDNGETSQEFYTYNFATSAISNLNIGFTINTGDNFGPTELPNIVFAATNAVLIDISFDTFCYNNTFYGQEYYNCKFGFYFSNNFISSSSHDVTFADSCYNNFINGPITNTKIGAGFQDNNITGQISACIFMDTFHDNTITTTLGLVGVYTHAPFRNNVLSGDFMYNRCKGIFANNTSDIHIGYNDFNDNFTNNTINGADFNLMPIEDDTLGLGMGYFYLYRNTFGYTNTNTFNSVFSYNNIGVMENCIIGSPTVYADATSIQYFVGNNITRLSSSTFYGLSITEDEETLLIMIIYGNNIQFIDSCTIDIWEMSYNNFVGFAYCSILWIMSLNTGHMFRGTDLNPFEIFGLSSSNISFLEATPSELTSSGLGNYPLKNQIINGNKGTAYAKFETNFSLSYGQPLTTGTAHLQGWIPANAIPTQITVILDPVLTADAPCEIQVGIETDNETYAFPFTLVSAATDTIINTVSTKTTAPRQIKLSIQNGNILTGGLEVWVDYIIPYS